MVFGPSPVLEVSIEPAGKATAIRVVPGGQAVWVSRMASMMGGAVTMCGLSGGDIGSLLAPMLDEQPFRSRLVPTQAPTGCFVVDQRHEPSVEIASDWARPPSPGEVEALVAATADAGRYADVVVVCNPMPGDALPLDVYTTVVADAAAAGALVVVDLSTPRLEAALRGGAAVVKLNDWELAELVVAPVDTPADRRAAMNRLRDLGARSAVVTRGSCSAVAVDVHGDSIELTPPLLGVGRAAGCGDAMTGALAAALAQGSTWLDAVVLGMAAGAAHFAGRDETSRAAIDELVHHVSWQRVPV